MTANITSAICYFDESDPHNVGWAYRTDGDRQDSGPLSFDGESDPSTDPRAALVAHLGRNGVTIEIGALRYDDREGGSFVWTA